MSICDFFFNIAAVNLHKLSASSVNFKKIRVKYFRSTNCHTFVTASEMIKRDLKKSYKSIDIIITVKPKKEITLYF